MNCGADSARSSKMMRAASEEEKQLQRILSSCTGGIKIVPEFEGGRT